MMHTAMAAQRGERARPGHYQGRSSNTSQQTCADDAARALLDESIATFFEVSAALDLSAPEQRSLLHLRAAELRSLSARPAGELGLDLLKLQRRLDYAIPLMRQMLAALRS